MQNISWPRLSIRPGGWQQLLVWSMVLFVVISLLDRLLQQSSSSIMAILVASIGSLVAVVLIWQQRQIKQLHNRCRQLEQIMASPAQPSTQSIAPAQIAHFETEQYFSNSQTKH